ncbi:fungal fruit body lectin-domain-containing protein [Aspergillus floccosus]
MLQRFANIPDDLRQSRKFAIIIFCNHIYSLMTYKLGIKIVNNTDDALRVIERTCWHYANGATWTEDNVLEMGGNGTSGMLRIKASPGDTFSVIVGFHNYNPWCDAQVDLQTDDTAVKLHPEYYNGGRLSGEASAGVTRTTSSGKTVKVQFHALPDGPVFIPIVTYS